jgi:ABC-type transport system involved in multi-copper enzyme maturation permease subunit
MKLSAAVRVFRWLVTDTFRQSVATSAFWLMLVISSVCIAICLSVSVRENAPLIQDDELDMSVGRGEISIGYGAFKLSLFRDAERAVHMIYVVLGKWGAGTVGLLLALIWTAGFIPTFLEPSSATVLLAKPVPRWMLLLGKTVGVIAFVAFQSGVFVLGTWLALGVRTGYYDGGYLLVWPVFVCQFTIVFAFSVMLGVWSRSTVVCVFGGVIFCLICYCFNYTRHAMVALPELDPNVPRLPFFSSTSLEIGYWLLPKPADLMIVLDQFLRTSQHLTPLAEFTKVQEMGRFDPLFSISTSLLTGAVLFLIAAHQMKKLSY